MHKHLVDLVIRELNKSGKVLRNSKVALLGLSFKENVKDHRNSKAKDVINELKSYGISIVGCDPLLGGETVSNVFGVEHKEITELEDVDGLIIISPHEVFKGVDWEVLKQNMGRDPFVIDLKEFFNGKKIEELGFNYRTI